MDTKSALAMHAIGECAAELLKMLRKLNSDSGSDIFGSGSWPVDLVEVSFDLEGCERKGVLYSKKVIVDGSGTVSDAPLLLIENALAPAYMHVTYSLTSMPSVLFSGIVA